MENNNNSQASNPISDDEQLGQLSNINKADSVAFTMEETGSDYKITKDTDTDLDDPFSTPESLSPGSSPPMTIPKNFKPRTRRTSDVIDSIGDLVIQDIGDAQRLGSTPDRVPVSPLSSGYGSFGNGNTPRWSSNPSSPVIKIPDLTDLAKSSITDASSLEKFPDTSQWGSNPPSPVTRTPRVTDADKNSVIDATAKKKDPNIAFWHSKLFSPKTPDVTDGDKDGSLVEQASNATNWKLSLPSLVTDASDVTDAGKNSVIDATPMEKDPDTPTRLVQRVGQ